MRPYRQGCAALLVAVTAAGAMTCGARDAFAQAGAGAERYEVTITPPKRPGSEAPAAPVVAPMPSPEAAAPPPSLEGSGAESAPAAAAAKSADSSAAPAKNEVAAVPATPSGPPRTLQVGAFRQQDSAEALRKHLSGAFPDVEILEVRSGGEPLYRVNVGRIPKGPALQDLKRRLAEAGYPSFDVPVAAQPSQD